MKKATKKLLSGALAVTMLASASPLSGVFALAGENTEKTDGKDAEYSVSEKGNYSASENAADKNQFSADEAAKETAEKVNAESGARETRGEFECYIREEYGAVTITGYTGSASHVVIPSEIDGYTVDAIGSTAFNGNTTMVSVEIPDTVDYVAGFNNCTALTSVTLPDSVSQLEAAFRGCTALKTVNIGSELEYLETYGTPFTGCTALERINISEENPYLCDIDGVVFSKYKTELIRYPQGRKDISYTVPDTVLNIYGDAFKDCAALGEIKVSENNPYFCDINGVVFTKDKTQLVKYPQGKKGTTYTIPESVTDVKDGAFTDSGVYNNGKNWENGVFYVGDWLIDGSGCSVSDLQIRNGTRVIADSAFTACEAIESVSVPDSVETIGDFAFSSCDSLKKVYIGSGVCIKDREEEIYYDVWDSWFEYSSELEVINVSSNNKTFSSLDGVLFSKDRTKLLVYPAGKKNVSYTVPAGVKEITGDAFSCNGYLTSVTISGTTEKISENAFAGCQGLTNVTIGDSVKEIGMYAFSNCEALKSVTIGNGTETIGEYAFSRCSSLSDIKIGDNVKSIDGFAFDMTAFSDNESNRENGALYIGKYLISVDESVSGEFTVKDGTVLIAGYAMARCEELTAVKLPGSLKYIGNGAFSECYGLKSVNIPSGAESLGYWAFGDCISLTEMNIPASVAEMGESPFGGCSGLENITVDSANKYFCSIDGVMFSKDKTAIIAYPGGRTNTKYIIPETVTVIENSAFRSCYNLEEVVIPDGVTRVGDGAFAFCGIKTIDLPESVNYLGLFAFEGSDKLTSVVIPEGVTVIRAWTFADCWALESVVIPRSVVEIEDYYEGVNFPGITYYGYAGSYADEFFEGGLILLDVELEQPSNGKNGVIRVENPEVVTVGDVVDRILDSAKSPVSAFAVEENTVTAFDKNGKVITDMETKVSEGMTFKLETTDGKTATYELKIGNVLSGDVNSDGFVDAADAILIKRYDAGIIDLTDAQLAAADVTGDGFVDAADAVRILRLDAGYAQ